MADELYHEQVLALAKRARAVGRLATPARSVTVDNPLCGDRITLDLDLANGRVAAIGHEVRGCLLCQAAAAAIALRAPGQTPAALVDEATRWRSVITTGTTGDAAEGTWPELDSFTPVRAHKSRHDCVLLPFEALLQALDGGGAPCDACPAPGTTMPGPTMPGTTTPAMEDESSRRDDPRWLEAAI